MSNNQIQSSFEKFENEVRRIVRRGSKSPEFDSQIKEIASHFGDIFSEELRTGVTQREAETNSRKRIGSPTSIALQILSTPSRVSRGLRLQKVALVAAYAFAPLYMGLEYGALRNWHGPALTIYGSIAIGTFLLSPFLFGIGAVLSRKVIWKPIVVLVPASVVLFGLCIVAFAPLYAQYSESLGMGNSQLTPAQTTLISALIDGFQYTERLVGIFVVCGLFTLVTGRFWLVRLSLLQILTG